MKEFILGIRNELIKNNHNFINEINLKKENNKYTLFTYIYTFNQRGDNIKKLLKLEFNEVLNLEKVEKFIKEYTEIEKKENKEIFEFTDNDNVYLFRIKKNNYQNSDFDFRIKGDFSLKILSGKLKEDKEDKVINSEKLIWNF